MTRYRNRRLEGVLRKATAQFPCSVVTGPRQSGKTTLVRHCLGARYRYLSLDEPDVRTMAIDDPRLFIQVNKPPLIIDEIQYAPDLLGYIKRRVDESRDVAGQYVLTGSQMFPLMAGVTESLAGRIAVLSLLPLSWGERLETKVSSSPVADSIGKIPDMASSVETTLSGIVRGSYPETVFDPARETRLWYASYVQTYLERDVRRLRNVGDIEEFQRFMRALAARNGQILNMAELGRDIGVALNTVKAWISILVATYQVVLLRPYHRNLGKRLVKSPKVYFTDTGLACYLTGIQTVEQCLGTPQGGALLESAFLGELIRWHYNRGDQPAVYVWRTAAGEEVDFVLETGGRLYAYEVKMRAEYKLSLVASLRRFSGLFDNVYRGRLINLGDEIRTVGEKLEMVPFGWVATW